MKHSSISDEQLTRALGVYAGMVAHVVSNPERWLGLDQDPPPTAKLPARALDALRDRAFGDITPTSPHWHEQPLPKRVDWWVTRIGISAGLAAAAPRFAGVLADRIPLQSALGASAAGLAVCATAQEHGRTTPTDWIPLLAQVLFNRHLTPTTTATIPPADESQHQLAAPDNQGDTGGVVGKTGRGAHRAATTLWQLARTFVELQSLLDERPRGNLLARTVAKVPVVGVVGGWLDERGGIRKAARNTTQLINRP